MACPPYIIDILVAYDVAGRRGKLTHDGDEYLYSETCL